jgi:2-oxoacid:acceptor oxidoreductase gamma subunit (pyruvate/2-ketoisovalerate family)
MLEIRIHGRGGQGTVIASKALAAAFFAEGGYVQAFPAFGVERRGAPVAAFVRTDARPILLRCEIGQPDHLIVLDPTLLEAINLTEGLRTGGWVIINTPDPPEDVALSPSFRLATVDAGAIARAHRLGPANAPIVNTAILGAFAAATGLLGLDAVLEAIRQAVPARAAENVAAARAAAAAVRAGKSQRSGVRAFGSSVVPKGPEDTRTPERPNARTMAAQPPPLVWGPGPRIAVSVGSMAWNRTGTWRNLLPVHLNRPAPCTLACPAGTDVRGFLALAAAGRGQEALDLIRTVNPFPGVTGRVCPHFCEAACNRAGLDSPLAVGAIERFLADRGELGKVPAEGYRRRTARVAVVGGGPAGLSAAYQLARLGYPVTVFERRQGAGGLLRYGIPGYRLPRAVLDRELAALFAWGIDFRGGQRLGAQLTWDIVKAHDAVFLATGLSAPRSLAVPGADLPWVLDGLEFLERVSRGEQVPLGGRTVVVGGGNTAIDAARTARRLGAAVTLLYRRSRAEMPAIASEVEAAMVEGVAMDFHAMPAAIREQGGTLVVDVIRTEPGPPDASGRPAPRPIPGSEFTIPADTVIAAVGETADLRGLPPGLIVPEGPAAPAAGATIPGVFLGGDLITQAGSVAAAIGDGARAARRIHAFLEGMEAPEEVLPAAARFEDLHLDTIPLAPRARAPVLDAAIRLRGFAEVESGLSARRAAREAARCIHCGACTACDLCWALCPDAAILREPGPPPPGAPPPARPVRYWVDLEHCKGCGICVAECPRGAITVEGVR